MAIDLLNEKGLQYKVVKFERDQLELLSEMKKAYDWKTVPMIFSRNGQDIKLIGGYTDLQKWLSGD
tara:strand:+ start:23406 stop:23603 length:198 start_codon:yes stop_codon:yes gene_type:complete